jgi:hypothetical protein
MRFVMAVVGGFSRSVWRITGKCVIITVKDRGKQFRLKSENGFLNGSIASMAQWMSIPNECGNLVSNQFAEKRFMILSILLTKDNINISPSIEPETDKGIIHKLGECAKNGMIETAKIGGAFNLN